MAVVINDMEVTPQPAAQAAEAQGKAGDGGDKDKIKQIEKTLHQKQQRTSRLEAY